MQARLSTVTDSRRRLAARVASGLPTPVPLCLDALGARLAERLGYHAGYVSGGGIGFAKAVSEGLLTLTELAEATASLTLRSGIPIIVDGGVGFGDPVHVTRMMWEFEAAGAAAVEVEDQVAPKRVSHHRGIEHLVGSSEMVDKIAAAVAARQDPNFLVIARTGALRHEGAGAACARARAYVEAGADVVLVPMPYSEGELEQIRAAVDVPLATIGLFDHAAQAYAQGVTLFIDSITPHVVTFAATRELLRRHLEGLPSGAEGSDIMATYRELGDVGGFEGLYDIERATTEQGT